MARSRIVNLANFQQFTAVNLLADLGHDAGKLIVPNGIQFHIVWNLPDGKQARQILGMSVGSAFTPTPTLAEQARAALVTGSSWTAFAAFLAPTTSLAAVQLRDIRVADQPLVASTGTSTPGTSAGTALPSETAMVTTIRTAQVGPGNRGRAYWCGFATNAIGTGDTIAAACVTAGTNFGGNVSSAMTAIGGTWCITLPHRLAYTSPVTGTQHPERPAQMKPITAQLVRDNHWDTQRRRGLK